MSTIITPKMAADILGGIKSWRVTYSQSDAGDMFINGEISVETEYESVCEYWDVRVTVPVTGSERELTFSTLYESDWSEPEGAEWHFETDGDRMVIRVNQRDGWSETVFTHHSTLTA